MRIWANFPPKWFQIWSNWPAGINLFFFLFPFYFPKSGTDQILPYDLIRLTYNYNKTIYGISFNIRAILGMYILWTIFFIYNISCFWPKRFYLFDPVRGRGHPNKNSGPGQRLTTHRCWKITFLGTHETTVYVGVFSANRNSSSLNQPIETLQNRNLRKKPFHVYPKMLCFNIGIYYISILHFKTWL